eukprot:scaffold3827_cov179-Cylindrotheca_fusiformis.AAC.26
MPSIASFPICSRCVVACFIASKVLLIVLLLSTVGIFASILTVFSCQFFTYRTIDGMLWEGLDAPFDELPKAAVGLFFYSQETTTSRQPVFGDSCEKYPDWQEAGQNAVFQAAQWCCIFAPVAAFLAWVQVLLEMVWCLLACLPPNLPPPPGERNAGCCIYTQWGKNATSENGIDGDSKSENEDSLDSDSQSQSKLQDHPEAPKESHPEAPRESSPDPPEESATESKSAAVRPDGSLESKSITIRPDGSVLVEIQTSEGSSPDSVQRFVYPNEAAARFAGHIIDTLESDEEEVEVDPVEEWDNAEELVSSLQNDESEQIDADESSGASTPVATNGSFHSTSNETNTETSVLVKPDGTVDVSITTVNDAGTPFTQVMTYPNEAAAKAAGLELGRYSSLANRNYSNESKCSRGPAPTTNLNLECNA